MRQGDPLPRKRLCSPPPRGTVIPGEFFASFDVPRPWLGLSHLTSDAWQGLPLSPGGFCSPWKRACTPAATITPPFPSTHSSRHPNRIGQRECDRNPLPPEDYRRPFPAASVPAIPSHPRIHRVAVRPAPGKTFHPACRAPPRPPATRNIVGRAASSWCLANWARLRNGFASASAATPFNAPIPSFIHLVRPELAPSLATCVLAVSKRGHKFSTCANPASWKLAATVMKQPPSPRSRTSRWFPAAPRP